MYFSKFGENMIHLKFKSAEGFRQAMQVASSQEYTTKENDILQNPTTKINHPHNNKHQ